VQGTNTPIASTENFSLAVSGGAIVHPSTSSLILSGLLIDSGAALTHLSTQSNLDLTVLGDAVVQTNGFISVDAKGYNGSHGGPGAGLMLTNDGSGGGYGGAGGASASNIPGGSTYGSASQPVDLGSRGGLNPTYSGFCQGGGAVLMRVAGTLTVNGEISANGNSALFEAGGGGAGGSLWLTARQINGLGLIAANGGDGEDSGGGGGGGGRIAIYSRSNNFAGAIYAAGGIGANPGQNGTVLVTNIPAPQIITQSPADIVNRIKGQFNYGDGRKVANSDQLMKFWNGGVSYPYQSHELWFLTENQRWGKLPMDLDTKAIIGKVNREDMWREAAKNISAAASDIPKTTSRGKETFFDGKVFDPADPKAYLASLQIKKVA